MCTRASRWWATCGGTGAARWPARAEGVARPPVPGNARAASTRRGLRACAPATRARYRLGVAMAFRALLATAALAAALVAPAGAHAAYRTFRSPTGKLGCAFYSD